MAKQTVGFGERHVEKFVAGAVGAILLGVVFLYGIQDPYTVEAGGDEVGPSRFYAMIQEETERVAQAMKNAQPPEPQPWKPPAEARPGRTVVTEVTAVPVPINPTVPLVAGDIQVGNLKLVDILPPSQPVVTTGRAYAELPPPVVTTIGEQIGAAPPQPMTTLPQDIQWVALFAVVDRKAQQEAFMQAKYVPSRQQLIVMGVEVERQRLMPDGEWSQQTEVFRPYAPTQIEAKANLQTVREDTGELSIPETEYAYRDALLQAVATREAQSRILRADFQSLLANEAQIDWRVPEEGKLPGVEIDWQQDFQVVVEQKEEELGPGGLAAGAQSGRQQIKKLQEEREAATKKEDWLEVERILRDLAAHQDATPAEKQDAEQLLRNLRPQILAAELREQNRMAPADSSVLGSDQDVMWATDPTAEPGQTYRYRVRLLAVNPHAGFTRLMADPQDAAKLILTGQWSDWSEPVTVPQNQYLFFTSADEKNNTARVEINRWTRGTWVQPGRREITEGQPISFTDRFVNYTYDGVVASLDFDEPYLVRKIGRNGEISYSDSKTSAVLTLITSDGDVEERIADVDLRERREVVRKINEENEKLKKREGGTTEIRQPIRERDIEPPRMRGGPDRFYDRDRGRGRDRGRLEDY